MATPEVEQYIKNELARGTSRSEIESNLLQNGWNDDEVARGFRAVETSERDKAHQEEAPSPSLPHSGPDSVPGESVSPEPGTPGDSSGFPGPFALLRESFRYVAGRFWTLVGILLIFFVIGFIAQLAIQFFYGISFAVLFGFAGDSSENVGGVLMAIVALVSVLGLAASVFIRYWSTGSFLAGLQSRHPSIGDAIKRGAGLAWPLFVLGVFSALVILGASIPFIIPAFLFLVWFSLAYYIAVEEDKRGFAALVRSREYMRERTFGVLGRTLFLALPGLVAFILGAVTIPFLFSDGGGLDSVAVLIFVLLALLVSLALIIFYTFVVPAYMYIIYKHLKRLNPNPEPASGLRRWSIGLSIWSIVAVAIGFTLGASLLLSVFNQPREIFDIDPTGQGTEIPESFPEPGDI